MLSRTFQRKHSIYYTDVSPISVTFRNSETGSLACATNTHCGKNGHHLEQCDSGRNGDHFLSQDAFTGPKWTHILDNNFSTGKVVEFSTSALYIPMMQLQAQQNTNMSGMNGIDRIQNVHF